MENDILQLILYSTILPFSTTALWFVMFTLRMPLTVLLASFTALAAASSQLFLLLARISITLSMGMAVFGLNDGRSYKATEKTNYPPQGCRVFSATRRTAGRMPSFVDRSYAL